MAHADGSHSTRHMDPRLRPSRHSEPLPSAGSLLRIWPYKFDGPFNEGELLFLNGRWAPAQGKRDAEAELQARRAQEDRRGLSRTRAAERGGDNIYNNIDNRVGASGGGIIRLLPGGRGGRGGNVVAEMPGSGSGSRSGSRSRGVSPGLLGACSACSACRCTGAQPQLAELEHSTLVGKDHGRPFHYPSHYLDYAIAPAVPVPGLSGFKFDLSPLQSLKPLDTTSPSSSAGTSSVATSASTRMTFDSDDGAALDDSDDEVSRAARRPPGHDNNTDQQQQDQELKGKSRQRSTEPPTIATTPPAPTTDPHDDNCDYEDGRNIASSAASATDVSSDHYDDSSTNYDDGASSRDEFLSDAGYESDMISAGSTSVSSSIWDYRFENGRRYHKFRDGIYNFPNDDPEQEREDMKHGMVRILCEDKLHFAPIGDNPHEVLDVGTGTGIWAIEMGDLYPSANVLGIDLSPIQPAWVPPNVRFMVDDVESPWLHPRDHFDYIHSRHTVMAIRDWPKLLRRAHEHLKPGGFMELQEILHIPSSTNGTSLENNPIAQFWHHVDQGLSNLGIPFQLSRGHQLADMMRDCGYVNVTEHVFEVPLGPWHRDQRLRTVGQFWRVVLTEGLQAIALGPLMRGLQWNRDEVEAFLVEVRRAWDNEQIWAKPRMIMPLTCVYGQKPA